VVGLAGGGVEGGEHGVALELDDGAAVVEHVGDGRPEVAVEHLDHLFGPGPLREGGEAAQVGEEGGHLDHRPAQFRLAGVGEEGGRHVR
jgi:hypothetical protein